MLLKNEMLSAISETSYTDFFNKYNITSLDKQKIIDYVNNNSLQIYTSVFVTMFISCKHIGRCISFRFLSLLNSKNIQNEN